MSNATLTRAEAAAIAREAIDLAYEHIARCPSAAGRLRARTALDAAEQSLACDAARPAIRWACAAVARLYGYASPEFAAVQRKYEAVYESHLS